jgi:hypothetical protein
MASTALVQYEIDTPLITLTRKIGKEKAVRAWRRSRLAVEARGARFQELNFPDVARRDSLYLAGNVLGPQALACEHGARRAAGLPSRFLDRKTKGDEMLVFRALAYFAKAWMVAVLLAALGIPAGRLKMPVDKWTDPDIGPRRGLSPTKARPLPEMNLRSAPEFPWKAGPPA